jgi:hypothetical protein
MKNAIKNLSAGWGAALLVFLTPVVLAEDASNSGEHLSFKTPQAAVDALIAALKKDDTAALPSLIGPGTDGVLSSGDDVQDSSERAAFLSRYKTQHSLTGEGDERTLNVGEEDWPLPIPAIERDGRWYLDGAAGAEEMIYRRIGGNELGAIAVCHGLVDAQREYASVGHDGDAAGVYALKPISDDGMQNGLYWPTVEGETPSPAGQFVAAAAEQGYRRGESKIPYHGYYYRLLYRQGGHAQGGVREYFSNGLLTEGFAVIAWPAQYGVSGIMTFTVNQDGVVFEKDLGEETESTANTISMFDPDSTWTTVSNND